MNNNLISIIIPCYNQGEFLHESILSVYNQTYPNWECIIIDDGSTDSSEAIASEWVSKDNRCKYFFKEKGGVSSARNLGIEKAKGKYIQFLDSDDFIDERKLELSLNELDSLRNKDVKIVISNFRMFYEIHTKSAMPYCDLKEDLFTFESLLYKWNEGFSIPIHCGFFHSSLFEEIRFPENMSAQEDWIVWVKIFKKGINAKFIDMPLAFYRRNPNSRTMSKGIFEDQIKAYEYFKFFLSEDEYQKLSVVLISRYYLSNNDFKKRLKETKSSNTYQTGLMIKKVLKFFRVLKPFKKFIPIILKLKSK